MGSLTAPLDSLDGRRFKTVARKLETVRELLGAVIDRNPGLIAHLVAALNAVFHGTGRRDTPHQIGAGNYVGEWPERRDIFYWTAACFVAEARFAALMPVLAPMAGTPSLDGARAISGMDAKSRSSPAVLLHDPIITSLT